MSQKAVRILGIDPGLNHTGYGLVDFVPGHFTYVASGVLNVPASYSFLLPRFVPILL